MVDRNAPSVTLRVLAISLLLGTAGCGVDSAGTGNGGSTYDDAGIPSYSGGTSNTTILSWMPPTQNTDGSALTDLAGYHVHYGQSLNAMTRMIDIGNSGQTSQFIDDLDEGTWYFAVTAYNGAGLESGMSELTAKRIR